MREIKFRGRDTENSNWIYGSLFRFTGNINQDQCYISDYGSMVDHNLTEDINDAAIGFFRRVESETVGQYTGLKDKNGVEIYEGDIIRYKWGSHEDFQEELIKWDEYYTGYPPYLDDYSMPNKNTVEVIGNVYEHPHLLEVD